jgi:hypothetical protein
VQTENDAFSLPGTDRYYTAGGRFSFVSPTGAMPAGLEGFANYLLGPGGVRLEFDLQQVIYTPDDTQLYNPNPHDRPYAGQITVRSRFIVDGDNTRSIAGVALGIVGPAGLGQSVQNGFHDIIGDTSNKGWRYQLHDEPTLDFSGERIWRQDVASLGPFTVQALPQVSGQVGNTEIYAQGGAVLRIGQGLDADYGTSLIQPGLSGTDAYTPTQAVSWYVFGGADGRVVAHDMLVQGNDFRNSRGVALTPLQGDLEVGGAVIYAGFRLSATEVFTTPEFHGAAPAFQYGSLTLSKAF